jgi:hypothetical protein
MNTGRRLKCERHSLSRDDLIGDSRAAVAAMRRVSSPKESLETPRADILGVLHRGLLVIVGAEVGFGTETRELPRRGRTTRRLSVDVAVDTPVDHASGTREPTVRFPLDTIELLAQTTRSAERAMFALWRRSTRPATFWRHRTPRHKSVQTPNGDVE